VALNIGYLDRYFSAISMSPALHTSKVKPTGTGQLEKSVTAPLYKGSHLRKST
jgi:hypothetical protein